MLPVFGKPLFLAQTAVLCFVPGISVAFHKEKLV